MADDEHVRIVLVGAEAIAEWREKNPGKPLDLRRAPLRRAALQHADLTAADLREANLERADLRWTDLDNADLTGANLTRADLHKAELNRATLREANLTAANLEDATIEGADFTAAIFSRTRLLNTTLTAAVGLDQVIHRGPSEVDAETLRNSGRLPDRFLKGLGLYDPYQATVLNVLVGSPSDLGEDRLIVQKAIYTWNNDNTKQDRVVLLPRLWETDAVPEAGDGQEIINRQLVDSSHILVALFWNRLGTPTGRAEAGTVEEIERFIESGRPVLIYFCTRVVEPDAIDLNQLHHLRKFKTNIQPRALVWSYDKTERLTAEIKRHLKKTVENLFRTSAP